MTGDAAPAGRSTGLVAVLAAVVAFLLVGVSTAATLAGAGGVGLVLVGLYRGSRVLATVAGVALFGALVLAAAGGAGPGQSLAAGVASVLAWTFAHAALDLRESVGAAPSRDHELAHVAGTTGLVGGVAVSLHLVYSVDWGAVPPLAAALLLFGGVALTAALRR